jgi:hypothetical protein
MLTEASLRQFLAARETYVFSDVLIMRTCFFGVNAKMPAFVNKYPSWLDGYGHMTRSLYFDRL